MAVSRRGLRQAGTVLTEQPVPSAWTGPWAAPWQGPSLGLWGSEGGGPNPKAKAGCEAARGPGRQGPRSPCCEASPAPCPRSLSLHGADLRGGTCFDSDLVNVRVPGPPGDPDSRGRWWPSTVPRQGCLGSPASGRACEWGCSPPSRGWGRLQVSGHGQPGPPFLGKGLRPQPGSARLSRAGPTLGPRDVQREPRPRRAPSPYSAPETTPGPRHGASLSLGRSWGPAVCPC